MTDLRRRRRPGLFGLVRAVTRGDAPRCNFCGASAAAVALVVGAGPREAYICPDCVHQVAAQAGAAPPVHPRPAA